jgi:nucleotide sugar dehydrogenase
MAKNGIKSYGFDINPNKIEMLKNGENYIIEEDWISDVLRKNTSFLEFSNEVDKASEKGDVIIVAVPTPNKGDGKTDLSFLLSAYKSIIKNEISGKLLITESTVPPGTTVNVIKPYLEERTGLKAGTDFLLVFSPERIDPGNKVNTIWNTPKVVGGINEISTEAAYQLYKHITNNVVKVSSPTTAEFVKVMENTQRDVNIALTNLFAIIAGELGVDIEEALDAAATKWNFMRLKPGCGVGGECIGPVANMLIEVAERLGIDVSLLKAARTLNDFMPEYTVNLVIKALNEGHIKLSDAKISILGLSYKKDSKDTRNSPALRIIELLKEKGINNITTYDPLVKMEIEGVAMVGTLNKAINGKDCIIIATDHEMFKTVNPPRDTIIVDGRNMFSGIMERYYGIGKNVVNPPMVNNNLKDQLKF